MGSATPSGNQAEGDLWCKVIAQTQYALKTGALQSIETSCEWIAQGGIEFLVRVSSNLERKASSPKPAGFNPFLPYDPDLFVADLSPTHLCLLNKYNVAQHHLLIVTRAFEPQETLLTLPDFEALWLCMREIGQHQIASLGFYNSGKQAGASQPHRHFQLVPLPLSSAPSLPIQVALDAMIGTDEVGRSPMLPFRHAVFRLSEATTAPEIHAAYLRLLNHLGLTSPELPAYNLLVTRQWLLLVPRRQEQFESIPVNALGFAGSLFVRNQAQLEQLRQLGPLTLLSQVADQVS
jgi:sulfate adenylyltransferase (ADP) / ATP adenylyltransferase